MASQVSSQASFDLLGKGLGLDVRAAIRTATAAGVVMPWKGGVLTVFRACLMESIRDIERHPRGRLLQQFLSIGPYFDSGPIPRKRAAKFLTDNETASAISFVYAFVVRSFQGRLAELLAIPAMLQILRRLKQRGVVPSRTSLYVGDSVMARTRDRTTFAKGADFHMLVKSSKLDSARISVPGVGEVKSFIGNPEDLIPQLKRHLSRIAIGIRLCEREYSAGEISLAAAPVRIVVFPSSWKFPRVFRYERIAGRTLLHVDRTGPPEAGDIVTDLRGGRWSIHLRWSQEALTEAAYEMTFWYMGKIGELIYKGSVPWAWKPMTPAEAGRNAAKMMLYYAILRARSSFENQSAVALYNAYGFGYALGSSFRDKHGRHEMLWPEDLQEIAVSGKTKHGCRLRGWVPSTAAVASGRAPNST